MKHKNILFLSLLFFYSLQANPTPILDATIAVTSENTTALSDQASPQFSEKKRIVTRFDLGNKELKAKTSNDLDAFLNQIEKLCLAEKEFHCTKVASAYLGTYGFCAATTVAHELGHALTAKALTGLPAHISFGSYDQDFGNSLITINGINPFTAVTSCFILQNDPYRKIKDIIISANGPLAGIAFNAASLALINIFEEYKHTKSIIKAIKNGIKKPLFSQEHPLINLLCCSLMCMDFMNLLPRSITGIKGISGNDGYHIAKYIPGGSALMTLISLLGCKYIIQKYRNTPWPNTPLPSKLLPNKGLRQLLN